MDGNRFDELTKSLARPDSRRGVLKRFGPGLARLFVLLALVGPFAVPGNVAGGPLDEQIPTTTNAQPDGPAGDTSVQSETNSNRIDIFPSLCPAGTDANGTSSFNQLAIACSAQGIPPFPFSISVEGVAFGSVTPNQPGVVSLTGLPAGTITIHVEAKYPYKTPVAFCYAYLNGRVDRPLTRYQVTDAWSVSIHDLFEGQTAGCYWFYIAPSPSYAFIKTFECPAGFNVTSAGPTELKQACPPSTTPVEFILTHATAGVSRASTTAESPGVKFPYLDAGDVTIREVVPPGLGVPIVYCESTLRTNNGDVTVRQYDRQIMASVDSIQSSIDTVGVAVICDWFNVPGEVSAGRGEESPRGDQVIISTEPATAPIPTVTAKPTSPPAEPTAPPAEVNPTVPGGNDVPPGGGNDVDPPGQNEQPPDPTPTPHIIT